jgi:hypothetical protein
MHPKTPTYYLLVPKSTHFSGALKKPSQQMVAKALIIYTGYDCAMESSVRQTKGVVTKRT